MLTLYLNIIKVPKNNKQCLCLSDQEKQQIANEIQRDLNQEEQSTMQPILSDIMKAIQRVRQQKGLDIVLEQGAVVDGGIDITSEVSQQLAK